MFDLLPILKAISMYCPLIVVVLMTVFLVCISLLSAYAAIFKAKHVSHRALRPAYRVGMLICSIMALRFFLMFFAMLMNFVVLMLLMNQ